MKTILFILTLLPLLGISQTWKHYDSVNNVSIETSQIDTPLNGIETKLLLFKFNNESNQSITFNYSLELEYNYITQNNSDNNNYTIVIPANSNVIAERKVFLEFLDKNISKTRLTNYKLLTN